MRIFKKGFLLSLVVMISAWLTACSGGETAEQGAPSDSETRVYHSEKGDVKVPAQPKRVAVFATAYVGNLLKLGITPIAVDQWATGSQFFGNKLDGAEVVSTDNLEKLVALNPDLIIVYSYDQKVVDKLSQIAPTVAFTYEKYDYLQQHIEIGKLVGKEQEAREWVEQWQEKAKVEREKVQKALGSDATVTVLEQFGKDLYVYGKNWGRGTEVIYQALGLKAPKKLEEDVFGQGWKAISAEMIPQYAGDYIFVGKSADTNNAFMETNVWKNLPAVKNNRVIEFDSKSFYFNDPISLEKELEIIVKELTSRK
ncbi:iron-hydroxamate ABC transporter substrate-binding protein [Staphylospora marina]|uniref:iron-hydroxamate ABC transporter substrate-binding protein n=1 Tax=Staphylospora marina TaxID=2490858 RepID=UPI001F154B5F|nr:iron-hydroxamate ABC transporter substrate-binding protein [Staphylospora marina]